jgi:hypothetical protein
MLVMVIINYCATLHVQQTSTIAVNPHPVILNITNKFFCPIFDTPHAQAIKNQANACLFLLFIVD